MTTGAHLIAAEQQRRQIPKEWIVEWDDWTNESLVSLAADPIVSREMKVFAGWELDYRDAFGIVVDYDEKWNLRRRKA